MRTAVRWTILITVIAVLLGVFAPGVYAQDKSLVWERFDVSIVVNASGSFDVAERQTIRFTSGTFTAGYRDILKQNYGYIDNWAVSDSRGNEYIQTGGGEQPYTFTVTDSGDRYVIEWFFPPTANSAETYTLSYTVHDGLRFYEGGDQVWWKAIFGDRSFPVLAGTVRVLVPETARIQEWAAYINSRDARDSATATVLEDERAVIFELTQRLNAGDEFEVRVQFTPGVVDGTVQPWQQRADEEVARREAEMAFREKWGPVATLFFCLGGLLLGLGGPAGLYALWYRMGRDKPVEMVADYLPEAPSGLTPAIAGTLLDESADMEDILATLIDLARRKAISITEDKQEGWMRTSTDFIYRRERDDVPLAPYEKKLLDAVFGKKDEVRLSDLKQKFYTKIDGIKKEIYEAVVAEGLFPSSPEGVRNQFGCTAAVLMIVAAGLGIVLVALFGNLTGAAVLPGVGLGFAAIALMILSRYMPRKTDKGAEEAARWQAFRTYLKDIDKYSDLEAQKEIWDRWLPYAIAFGFEKEYIRKFEQVQAPAPGWYFPTPTAYGGHRPWYYDTPGTPRPVSTGGGSMLPSGGGMMPGGGLSDMSKGMGTSLAAMSAGLGAMLASASSTFTSRPSSSSSGGGWSSGGGGFSGGGFSGGGGGGGGGGGFR